MELSLKAMVSQLSHPNTEPNIHLLMPTPLNLMQRSALIVKLMVRLTFNKLRSINFALRNLVHQSIGKFPYYVIFSQHTLTDGKEA